MSISPEVLAHDDPHHAVAGLGGPVAAWCDDRSREGIGEGAPGWIGRSVRGPAAQPIIGFYNALLPALGLWGLIAALAVLAWLTLG